MQPVRQWRRRWLLGPFRQLRKVLHRLETASLALRPWSPGGLARPLIHVGLRKAPQAADQLGPERLLRAQPPRVVLLQKVHREDRLNDGTRERWAQEELLTLDERERDILAYRVRSGTRHFTADDGGGYAVTLGSRRLVHVAGVPGSSSICETCPSR
jgi:hypothetical protein